MIESDTEGREVQRLQSDRELFETYRLDVYRLCYYMLQNASDAEDVCQDVFVTVLRRDRSGIEQVKPWLMKIAVNRCKNHLDRRSRGMRKEWLSFLKFHPRFSETTEEKVERKERSTELLRLLGALPVKIRSAMTLRFVNDLSLQEIAQTLDIPVGTVKSRLHKGISLLQRRTDSANYLQAMGDQSYEQSL